MAGNDVNSNILTTEAASPEAVILPVNAEKDPAQDVDSVYDEELPETREGDVKRRQIFRGALMWW
jgi:hypothetical protein